MDEAPHARPFSAVTWTLVVLNVGVFGLMWMAGGSALLFPLELISLFGGVDAALVWEGEIWRLAGGMFVHAALWHLGLNLWVLWQVGRLLEQVLGASRFLLVYLVSGIVGFATSLLLQPGVTCGASGAIFGVVGGLLALAAITREQPVSRFLFSALLPFVAMTLALGVLLPFVDNSAHIGGLLAGFVLTYGLLADETGARLAAMREADLLGPSEMVRLTPRFGTAALVTSALLFAALVPLSLRPFYSPRYQTTRAHTAIAHGELDAARDFAQAAARLAPDDAAVLLLQGRLLLEGSPEQRARAGAFLAEGLRALGERDPEIAFLRALQEAGSGGTEGVLFRDPVLTAGLCEATLALQGDKASPGFLNNCAWLYVKTDDEDVKDPPRAKELAQAAINKARPPGKPATVGDEELAAYLHTYAWTLAETGDPAEARAVLERVRAEGLSDSPLFDEDRRHFAARAKEAEKAKAAETAKEAEKAKAVEKVTGDVEAAPSDVPSDAPPEAPSGPPAP